MEVQSIIFKKQFFTKQQAIKWLQDHKFKKSFRGKLIEETYESFRMRQKDPSRYKSFKTKIINEGISFVFGIQ